MALQCAFLPSCALQKEPSLGFKNLQKKSGVLFPPFFLFEIQKSPELSTV
jgi:hypothetical protein